MAFVEALEMTAYIAVLDICRSAAKMRCSAVGRIMRDGYNGLYIMIDTFLKQAVINEFILSP
jgi:hypothetical protein